MARRPLLHVLTAVLAVTAVACSGDDDTADTLDDRGTPASGVTTAAEPDGSGPTSDTAAETASGGSSDGSSPGSPSTDRPVDGSDPSDPSVPDGGPTGPTTSSGATTSTSTSVAVTTTTVDPTVPPVVDAKAYVVFDMRAGRRLAADDADARLPVGSLMKLLTTHVAYNAGQPTKIVTAPSQSLLVEPDESRVGISAGQELPRDLLIRAMLKASANDAARLLAIDIAGSEEAYAALMNAAAADQGMTNTHAVNVTGLDAEGQYSSAADMTTLGVRLMGNISFQQTVKDPTAELNGQAIPNQNNLLTSYPGADGIKTGRTSGAGWCILASATRDNRRIVVAVLGAPDADARTAAATDLLDWAFTQP